jgi:hypothetical protein
MFKTTTPLQRLRAASYIMGDLPDSISTSDIGEFGQPISKAISSATVDDIAFAIQSLSDEADAVYRRVSALKNLHDRARRAGALGAELAVEAAARLEERRK